MNLKKKVTGHPRKECRLFKIIIASGRNTIDLIKGS